MPQYPRELIKAEVLGETATIQVVAHTNGQLIVIDLTTCSTQELSEAIAYGKSGYSDYRYTPAEMQMMKEVWESKHGKPAVTRQKPRSGLWSEQSGYGLYVNTSGDQ